MPRLAGGVHDDIHVVAERDEMARQLLQGEAFQVAAYQGGGLGGAPPISVAATFGVRPRSSMTVAMRWARSARTNSSSGSAKP